MKFTKNSFKLIKDIKESLNIKQSLAEEMKREEIAEALLSTEPTEAIDHEADIKGLAATKRPADLKEPNVDRTPYQYSRVGDDYIFKFNYMSKPYELKIRNTSAQPNIFNATFNVRGARNNKPLFKYGIGNVSNIAPTFKVILKLLKIFLDKRNPLQLHFVPADSVPFPSQFYTYTFDLLDELKSDIKGKYTVIRGNNKEGALFIIKRGDQQSRLMSKGWRPTDGSGMASQGEQEQEK